MILPEDMFRQLTDEGISLFVGVPDSLLKSFCSYVADNLPDDTHIVAANEGGAIGLAAGHYLATKGYGLVYMQNSGLGNAINPLLSLADPAVYSIPMLLLIGWRGEPGRHDEPQHVKQGRVTLDLLRTMEVPYFILEQSPHWKRTVTSACRVMKVQSRPAAIVVKAGTFAPYGPVPARPGSGKQPVYPLTREEALKLVAGQLGSRDVVVSTTGMLSRELFEYRQANGHVNAHARDFLTVGSMGHSSQIALGIALARPNRQVFCLDGDGAWLMHGGSPAVIGEAAPRNFKHIVFNNGAHDSVGGQPSAGFSVQFTKWAEACGYRHVWSVAEKDEIKVGLNKLQQSSGPSLLEIRIKPGARSNLGRPTLPPIDNRNLFMKELER